MRLDGRGKTRYFSKDSIKGGAKSEWLEKNKLTEESPLTAWFHSMIKTNASNDIMIPCYPSGYFGQTPKA